MPPSEMKIVLHRLRRNDALWYVGIAFVALLGLITYTSLTIWQGGLGFGVFAIVLSARLYLSSRMALFEPLQETVTSKIDTMERLRETLNALPEPVIVMRRNGVVELTNPATADFLGGTAEGQHISALLRAPAVHKAVKKALRKRQPQHAEFTLTGTVSRSCKAYVTLIGQAPPQEEELTEEARILIFITDLSNAKRLDEMRSDFIANASHELRTPLTSMLGFIETLLGHAKDDATARDKFLKIMQSQAERMLRLVQDLMSLSSIELNEHLPPETRINLLDIAHDVAASLAPVAVARSGKISVINHFESGIDPVIIGDRDQLIQVVQNLADNGLKYGGPEAEVTVTIGQGTPPGGDWQEPLQAGETMAMISSRAGISMEELFYLEVRDRGQGISRDDLPRLTERFYRADTEDSKARGGTGLGLAIVKHILNRHKGGLQIVTSPGEGAAFICLLVPQLVEDGNYQPVEFEAHFKT